MIINSKILLFSIVGIALSSYSVNDVFGELVSMDGELYLNDERIFEPILKLGEDTQIRIDYNFDSTPSNLTSVQVFIIDNPMLKEATRDYEYNVIEMLQNNGIKSENLPLPNNSSLSFTPNEIGNYAYIISAHFQNGDVSETIGAFAVVDAIGKSFNENNLCRDGFYGIIKPSYSDAVCVTENTKEKLIQRGWNHPYE